MVSILVVDDEARMRKLIKRILSNKYDIKGEAKDGKEALEKYEELDPDIITLDIQMPELDGVEVLSEIKEKDESKKVVVVSVVSPHEKNMEEIKEKADAHVTKPARKKELLDTVEKILEEEKDEK